MTKKKEFITSQKPGSSNFRRIANIGRFAIPPLFDGLDTFSSESDKKKSCLLNLFLEL